MLRSTFSYPQPYFKYDLIAGIVVCLIAIPLCLGVALASGAPLFSGLIAGFLGGIVVGIFSQSSVSVSGPSPGMIAIVIGAIATLGGFEAFLLSLLLAGILQVIIGILRAGFIADYVPSNVIQGLLCAIGILIIIKQLPFAFTYTSENQLLLDALRSASETLKLGPVDQILYQINLGALIISTISLALLIFFDITRYRYLKAIPGPIIVVVIGVIINSIYINFWPYLIQNNHELVNIPISQTIHDFFNLFMNPRWDNWNNPNTYLYAFIIAAVASLESLLNLEGIEKIDSIRRYVSRDRELIAQGIGNTLSGLIGGLPITSVIVRSSVNIQAGGKTKLATIIHGLLILLVVVFIPHWVNRIPLASLAAILIYVGYKLTKPTIYSKMYAQGSSQFIPFIITVLAIIFSDLLTGILIGLFFSFFFILRDNSKIQINLINEQHPFGVIKRMILPQQVSFLNKAALLSELDHIPTNTHLVIDARYTKYIDRDIIEIIDTFMRNQAPSKNITVNMLGFKKHYEIQKQLNFINVTTYDTQSTLKPKDVLAILKEGNKRFIGDQPIHRNLLDEIKATSAAQHPIAIVLGCIDSRVPIETIFDMGVGDVFVVRVAGNIVNDDILASMEFACHIAGAKLIVVLGHTYCGAIKAACENGATGQLDQLLNKIKPAVQSATHIHQNATQNDFIIDVTKININNSLQTIFNKSTILQDLIKNGNIGLIGALYDVSTGEVSFKDDFYQN